MFELLSFLPKNNKLESRRKVSENKDFLNIFMPSQDTKILEFNQYEKSDKAPFIIYTDRKYSDEESFNA